MGSAALIGTTAASAGLQLYGSYQAAKAQDAAGQYQAVAGHLQAEHAAKQGMEAMMAGYHNARMMEFEAEQVRVETRDKVNLLREAAGNFRAKQAAVAAASGVVITDGSLAAVRDKTTELTERDALVAMYSGAHESLIKEMEADNTRHAAANAFDAAFYEGVSSRMSGSLAAKTGAANANATMISGTSSALGTMAQGFSQYKSMTAGK